MRHLLVIGLLIGVMSIQARDFNGELYNAYIKGDMLTWETILNEMKSQYKRKPDYKLLEDIVESQYGFIGYLIGEKRKDKAGEELAFALKNLDILMKRNDKISRYWAYKCAFTGFKIGIAPYKAPFLGPKSFDYVNEALTLDEDDPYALVEYANGKYYAPVFAGGNKKLAMTSYKKAILLLEQDSVKLHKSWYYLMVKTNYGNLLSEIGDKNAALKVYNEILEYEPNYSWVANELRPNALKN